MAGSSALRPVTERTGREVPGPGSPGAPETSPGRGAGSPAPARRLLRRLIGGSAELLVALAITFGFFLVFLLILGRVFPSGVSLEALSTQLQQSHQEGWRSRDARAASSIGASAPVTVASLSILQQGVRSKSADAIAWNPARDGQALRDRDGVQTGVKGRAIVDFGAGNRLVLERSSLVIVSAPSKQPGEAAREQSVVVLEGEIWARFAAGDAIPRRLTFGETKLAVVSGPAADGPAEFRLHVKKNAPATISVLNGAVEVSSQSGRSRIGARQWGSVSTDGTVMPPRPLPGAPTPLQPGDGAAFAYQDLPPQIAFRWTEVPSVDRYRVVVAPARDRSRVAVDETVAGTSLVWGRLKEGSYVWRVSALADDAEGVPSDWRRLEVSRAAAPPSLDVQALPKTVAARTLRVKGRVDRHATLYVGGMQAKTQPDGTFDFELTLDPGVNVVVVEAVDETGNTAYWSQIVNATF